MKLSVRNWFLSLASASVLTQMVFAQSFPAPIPARGEQIILVQDKAPAAAPAPAVVAPAAPATVAAPVVDAVPAAEAPASSDDGPWKLFPDPIAGFNITGWIYGTGVYNGTNGGNTRYNGPMTMSDQEGAFINQFYLSATRGLKEELSWGAGVDVFWGNDYNASQSRGWELYSDRLVTPAAQKWNTGQDYGLASPQSYLTVGTTKHELKVGHFWTPIGYMVVQGPLNFFNTQPYGFMATNPFTHWGAMYTGNWSDNFYFQLAVVNGWDALDRPQNDPAVIVGGRYTFDEKKGFVQYHLITGNEPQNLGAGYGNRTLNNIVFDYNVTDKIEFVYESNLGWQENPAGIGTSTFYNFHPLAFYRINDCLRAGIRYEYFHDPGAFMAGIRNGNPNVGPYFGNNQTIATGLNWAPGGSKNLMIRPEIRYDWFNGQGLQPYNAGNSDHQWLFVVGAYMTF